MNESEREMLRVMSARVLALRDTVAILLAREAKRSNDPESFLAWVGDATDWRAHQIEKKEHLSQDAMANLESVRAESDWLVAAARSLVGRD